MAKNATTIERIAWRELTTSRRKLEEYRARRLAAIRELRRLGASHRAIGIAAGLSHTQVANLLAEAAP